MAFFAGLQQGMDAAKERKAKADAEKFDQAYKSHQQDIDTAKTNADVAATNVRTQLDQVTLDQARKDADQYSKNTAFEGTLTTPPGFFNKPVAYQRAYYQRRAEIALEHGDQNAFDNANQQIKNIDNGVKATDSHTLDMAKVDKIERIDPGQFAQKMQEAAQAINARLQIAGENNAEKNYLAGLNIAERTQLERMIVACRLAGDDINNSVRQAIASMQQQNADLRTDATNATNIDRADITQGGGGGVAPTINYNFGAGGGGAPPGSGMSIFQSYLKSLNGGNGGGAKPPNTGAGVQPPPAYKPLNPRVQASVASITADRQTPPETIAQGMRAIMAKGASADEVKSIIAGMRAAGDPRADAVNAAVFGGAAFAASRRGAIAPPPVNGVGAKPTNPFSLAP